MQKIPLVSLEFQAYQLKKGEQINQKRREIISKYGIFSVIVYKNQHCNVSLVASFSLPAEVHPIMYDTIGFHD